jgi:uroporphyrinogen-III synthase
MSQGLHRLGVLVTRPAEQAAALCGLIAARGGQAVRLPLQAIEPCRISGQWEEPAAADVVIFTSVNAVRQAQARVSLPLGAHTVVLAVGPATASALHAEGLSQAQAAQEQEGSEGSEGLLRLPVLAEAQGKHILIVTGTRTRPTLRRGLVARGATVHTWAVYRRVALAYEAETVRSALAAVEAAILTSGEALSRLCAIAPPESEARLKGIQLVVASQRVAEQARGLGFTRAALVAPRVRDQALVDCLSEWRAGTSRLPTHD